MIPLRAASPRMASSASLMPEEGEYPFLPSRMALIDGFDHVGGCLEVKVERVADVERQNFVSLLCDLVGDAGQVANGVADVFEAGGRGDFAKLRHGHAEILTAEGAEDPMKCNFFLICNSPLKPSSSGQ